MIPAIVFSKDRPLQLDALLRSLAKNWPYREVAVLWTASTEASWACYQQCAVENDWVQWIGEVDFQRDLDLQLRIQAACDSEFVVFFVDDDLLYRPVDETPYHAMLDDERLFAFSLRLGSNTNYCYPLDKRQTLGWVEPTRTGGVCWGWRTGEGDYGYPASTDGHIFPLALIRAMLGGESYRNPYELEVVLATKAAQNRSHPQLASYGRSRLVGIPHNRVIDAHPNRVGAGDARELLERYQRGERIDWAMMDFATVNAAHQEVPYVFRVREEEAA